MRTRILWSAAAALAAAAPLAVRSAPPAAETYRIDPVHSSVVFRVKHSNVSYFHGRFNKIAGTFTFDPDAANLGFDVTIETDSIDSNNPGRDKHLKSPDFFNAVEFPTITFKSSKVKSTAPDHFEMIGTLNLHGVSLPITVALEHTGAGEVRGGYARGFEGVFTIKRSEFGMTGYLDGLGDEVRVTVSLEGIRR